MTEMRRLFLVIWQLHRPALTPIIELSRLGLHWRFVSGRFERGASRGAKLGGLEDERLLRRRIILRIHETTRLAREEVGGM
jgi:hypothetical protein